MWTTDTLLGEESTGHSSCAGIAINTWLSDPKRSLYL